MSRQSKVKTVESRPEPAKGYGQYPSLVKMMTPSEKTEGATVETASGSMLAHRESAGASAPSRQAELFVVPDWPNMNYEAEAKLRAAINTHPAEMKIDFTQEWKALSPAQRQELYARGWKTGPTRKYGEILIGVTQWAKSEMLRLAVLSKRRLSPREAGPTQSSENKKE